MKEKSWNEPYECLKIPVQWEKPPVKLDIICDGGKHYETKFPLAAEKIDGWRILLLPPGEKFTLKADIKSESLDLIIPCKKTARAYDELFQKEQQAYHCISANRIQQIHSVKEENGTWKVGFAVNVCGMNVCMEAVSDDLLSWAAGEIINKPEAVPQEFHTDRIRGDIQGLYLYQTKEKCVVFGAGGQYLMLPVTFSQEIRPAADMKQLRTWKRVWSDIDIENRFDTELRFRTAPSVWPNIRLLPAEGKTDDIQADAHEFTLDLDTGTAMKIRISICGITLTWDRSSGMLESGAYGVECREKENCIHLRGFIDKNCGEIFCGQSMIFLLKNEEKKSGYVDNISGNLDKCTLETVLHNEISITVQGGTASIRELKVYGLRKLKYEPDTQRLLEKIKPGRLLHSEPHFQVYENRISDKNYGKPDAYTPDGETIVSLVRAVEEFQWRETKWGDMVRVLNRKEIWHPSFDVIQYPEIKSGIPVFDAAYKLALDTFCICKSRDYALPGQEGMWSAGAFQGKGQGFGVWMRDSAHIALRCGNLIDPKTARKTLLYTTSQGFDNGCDGAAMAIVGLWDYYLATDDITAVYEAWPRLLKNIAYLDELFMEEKNLVYAPQSTSNDAFEEPECEGYCLSTQCYDMKAYEAMAYLGRRIGADDTLVSHWEQRGDRLRYEIKTQYWNEQYGYYTSGPKGSESFSKGFWETSGEESVLWNKFSLCEDEQKKKILNHMEAAAMCEYGVVLFPYRKEQNHFCGSVWGVWEAGIASAASDAGREDIVYTLLYQQIRSCVMNKTFYEVIDSESGVAWRWPAQLWHAAGFISLIFYGILGISYDEKGMRIKPFLRKEFQGLYIRNFRYGGGLFEIITEGFGGFREMLLDNEITEVIPRGLGGKHQLRIKLEFTDSGKSDC
ncbi:MAG: hypothetical protein Q4D16_20455 [Eubacteriales bacterium]|nr:hypothetical protein [Eubacteriales bacterium]